MRTLPALIILLVAITARAQVPTAVMDNLLSVASLPTESSSSLVNGLLAYWALEDATNTERLDCSGNGYSLTPSNNPTKIAGVVGQGDRFYGNGVPARWLSGLTVPTFAITNGFSAAAWVSNSTSGNTGIIGDCLSGAPDTGWFVARYTGSFPSAAYFQIFQSGSSYMYVTGTALITNNVWQHVVCTYAGTGTNGMLVYINGTLDSISSRIQAGAIPTNINNSTYFIVGARSSPYVGGNDWLMTGAVDEVGLWTRSLTSTEVSELYNAGSGKYFNCK